MQILISRISMPWKTLEFMRIIAEGGRVNPRNKTYLTCKDISILLDISQRHVLNILAKKSISTEKDDTGKHLIQKAEFFRVFPDLMNQEIDGKKTKSEGNQAMKLLEEKVRHLQEMLDEKKKQTEFLMGQISINDDKQSKMLDAISAHSRLLEFKESASSPPRVDETDAKANKKFSLKRIFK